MKQTLKYLLKWLAKGLAIFFTFATLALIIISFIRPEWIKVAITWIGDLVKVLGNWNYLVAFLSACIESLPLIGTAVPGMNVMILVGGFWWGDHLVATVISAVAGAMIGNYIGYWIGKWFGKELLTKYGDWFWIGKTEARILEGQIEKNGFWYIVLGKFHNLTRSIIPFIAGSSWMAEKNFWLYNMIGSIIWAISIILLGIFFIDQYEIILDNMGKIVLILMIAIFGYMYFFQRSKLTNYMRDKQSEMEEKIAEKEKRRNIPR